MRGWRAQCTDCPTTIGDYGETIRVGAESTERGHAELWAWLHIQFHRGHRVTVSQFFRVAATFTHVNHDVLDALTKGAPWPHWTGTSATHRPTAASIGGPATAAGNSGGASTATAGASHHANAPPNPCTTRT